MRTRIQEPRAPRACFEEWLAEAESFPRRQPAAEELRAEHHVMEAVLSAMDEEARRLAGGAPLRGGFWAAVVDFNGAFVHRGVRPKEELFLVACRGERRRPDRNPIEAALRAHDSARQLTLGIRDTVVEGSPEGVLRLAVLCTHVLRAHLARQEEELRRADLPGDVRTCLRLAFDSTDAQALAEKGRAQFAAVARGLCEAAGIDHDLSPSPPVPDVPVGPRPARIPVQALEETRARFGTSA